MNAFKLTERLRGMLEVSRHQHAAIRERSKAAGLDLVDHGKLALEAEYHRGRADGIRLSLETVAQMLREESRHGV